jgi:branched-chain amino acid transport system ATP-binding protein
MTTEVPLAPAPDTDVREPLLHLRGITGGYGRTVVLRDVDLTVHRGSIDALLGPNGAGKTTLLRIAAGLLAPTAGTVALGEADVTRATPHERTRHGMCLIPEGRGVFRSLTVRENLALQIPPWDKETTIERALDAFPILRDRLRQVAGTMSGGEQQMLAVARAYLASPKVVLLDEVSMGLAPRIVDQIFASLVRLASEGISLLLVEQYVNTALEMADNVHILNHGAVTYSGRSSALDERAVVRDYLGGDLSEIADSPGRENTRRRNL